MDIDDLRQYINSGRYELTIHAKTEAANDQLFDYDIGAIARSGDILSVTDRTGGERNTWSRAGQPTAARLG